jgi:predicted GNAT family acetyltransferase
MALLRTERRLVELGPTDLTRLVALCRRDPAVNAFVEHRALSTELDRRRLGGAVWGYLDGDELVSACHMGANLVVVEADSEAIAAFADHAARSSRTCSSLVGPASAVLSMWQRLEPVWGPAREVRAEQPFMVIDGPPAVAADPLVRRLGIDDFDVVYPASVAMFTEEVGVSPEADGAGYYRARVAQLLSRGWSFARIENGRVLFKAEVGLATPQVCQIQGVYVDPAARGRGLAAPGMAAVVEMARAHIAPVVSLYVNAGNVAARAAYQRAGFAKTSTFATVLF